MRTHTLLLLTGVAAALASAPTSALAQSNTDIDAERFKPAVTYDGWVTAEGADVRPTADPWELGLFANYGLNPLVGRNGSDIRRKFVGGHLGFDLLGSVTLARPFSIGLDLPLYLAQSGDYNPSFGGLGDVRLVPKLRLLDDRESVGLALAVELRAPTHTGDYNGGARMVQGIPKLIFDHRFTRTGWRIGANAGVALRKSTDFYNVHAGSEFDYAVALGYRFGGINGKVELGGELNGGVGLSQQDSEEVPLEGFVYLRVDPSEEWEVMGGPGIGMLPGYGVPTFRGFIGVRYRPTSHDKDGDGIADDEDKCPDLAEDRDGYQDTDGCPEEDPDSDHDGVPDRDDDCPNAKETINGVDDDDGCPDTGDPRVIYEDGKFKILDQVHFETGSAKITQDSHSILDQVALTLKANPQIKHVRVEGHTDDTGPADTNMRLSRARASSVRRYLIGKGVSARASRRQGLRRVAPAGERNVGFGAREESSRRVRCREVVA